MSDASDAQVGDAGDAGTPLAEDLREDHLDSLQPLARRVGDAVEVCTFAQFASVPCDFNDLLPNDPLGERFGADDPSSPTAPEGDCSTS